MPMSVEHQINNAEERLRLAMLGSDVASLDDLISPDLIFTTHGGMVVSKQDDLTLHRSGTLRFRALEPSDQRVMMLGHVAYVSVRIRASGINNGTPFDSDLRFSGVWKWSEDQGWQVVAGQVTAVQM